jgi:hypothetical protein
MAVIRELYDKLCVRGVRESSLRRRLCAHLDELDTMLKQTTDNDQSDRMSPSLALALAVAAEEPNGLGVFFA